MHPTIADGIRATLPDPEWVRLPFVQRIYGITVRPEGEGYQVSVTLAVWRTDPGSELPGDLPDTPPGVQASMWERWPNLEFASSERPEKDVWDLQHYLGPLDVARFEGDGYLSWVIKPQVYMSTSAPGGPKWEGPLYVAPVAQAWARKQAGLELKRKLLNGVWEMVRAEK